MEEDDDAKLKAEIQAELDKISISSLEKSDVESDSKSETPSDDSDLDELPESVLHCINIIKNKSKTAEELILQDLEDTDVLSSSFGAFSNKHMHLRIGLATECKENPEQLMKMLSEIEKEEFMRSKTNRACPDSVPELDTHDLPLDEHVLPDDADINFGYCEVEERCRQSFEAWQDKQKELEDKENETLKAQRDREEKQFQEEEEKRYCWMKQFEVEKKKLENIQKVLFVSDFESEMLQWNNKFKNLHLQMEEERTRFKDLQEKEKVRLLKLQHNAAVKIQAKYKAFMAYKKYGPIIKEQVESKKRKAQEWKEKEAKIRQKEEEKRKRLEEEQRIEEERKKQNEEERQRREKEYEQKKNILRREREQLINKEKLRLREDKSQQLIIISALKKEEYNTKHLTVEDISRNKDNIAKKLVDNNSKKQENVSLWLVEESNKRENISRQLVFKESIEVPLKDSISNQAILADFKIEEKNENPAKKQCSEKLVKQERKYENIDQKHELGHPDLKQNMKEQFQLQELKSQIHKEETMEHAINENVGQEIQIILGHHQAINEVKNNETQKIIKDNQQEKVQKIEKEEVQEQNGPLYKENNALIISMKQELLPLKSENVEYIGENVILQEKEIDLKSKEIEENPTDNALNSELVIFNTTDATINKECKRNEQDYILGGHASCEDLGGCNSKSSRVSKEVNSLNSEVKEILEECHENRAEHENTVTYSIPASTLLSSIEEKRISWIKSFKPWCQIFKQHQQKKIVKRKRPVKCPADMMPPLNTLEILQCGPWNTLPQVTTVTLQDLPGCSLSTLAECMNLQFLSLQRCGLTSLQSLSNCKKLKYIDAQVCPLLFFHHLDTSTSYLSIQFDRMPSAQVWNQTGLWWFWFLISHLYWKYKLCGLESLKNLQQLIVDHNQLMSTKGLCDTPTVIYLDCSHNHLTEIEGIENCGLLQILKLQGNYLSEYTLSCVSQRKDYNLTTHFFLIFNRHSLLKMLPALRIVNGDTLNPYSENHTEEYYQLELAHFLTLCQSQIREFNLLIENYITGKGMAAVVIQSHWRGYIVRRQIHFFTRLHMAAAGPLPNSCIKNQIILKNEKRENIVNTQEQREKSAILIQAVWKGFIFRKKLTTALEAIKNEESEEEYEEIDVEDFTFDEAAVEKEWLALDSARFPSQTSLLSNQLHWPKISGNLKYDDTSLNLPNHPAQAWLCNEKENLFSSEHTQFNSRSENKTLSLTPESKTSRKSLLKSEKEEKISEEWYVVYLTLKYLKIERFRNEKSHVRCIIFNIFRMYILKLDTTANEKLERSKEYTYQWLHTQVGVHETTTSRNMKCNHFLPELDPDVLNGGRVQLVARLVSREDTDLDLSSMTSGSALSVNREKKNQAHRHSAGSSSKLWFPSELI
uniref:Leucine rich repeats and IQ motif containing 1 n=1 Tax=Propithecus coquereli TaxID=379532 RepID=A0A2K6F574_PROCO